MIKSLLFWVSTARYEEKKGV